MFRTLAKRCGKRNPFPKAICRWTNSEAFSTANWMRLMQSYTVIVSNEATGDRVYYTRFGKTFSRRRPTQINDQKSEAKLRQRALFKATNTAYIPTLSPDEKRTEKKHRNIDRRVSPPVYIGAVIVA